MIIFDSNIMLYYYISFDFCVLIRIYIVLEMIFLFHSVNLVRVNDKRSSKINGFMRRKHVNIRVSEMALTYYTNVTECGMHFLQTPSFFPFTHPAILHRCIFLLRLMLIFSYYVTSMHVQ